MDWRVAECIRTLRGEVDRMWPKRSKLSDGTIGNASHATRSSDHNPWLKDSKGQPIVTAIDITHDPDGGPDAAKLAERFRLMGKAGDKRIKYVISNRRIASGSFSAADKAKGRKPWEWWPYDGVNAHVKHVHLSVSTTQKYYDSTAAWNLVPKVTTTPKPTVKPTPKPIEKEENMELDTKIKLGAGTAAILHRPEVSVHEVLDWTLGNVVHTMDVVLQVQEQLAELKALLEQRPPG